ncbi:four helix bundle protein [Ruminococcus sp.]|uniref:four helix bundle protein n=1 Tax=Ruminococcus sp. TaxID=41978 RepID=UPI00342EFC97
MRRRGIGQRLEISDQKVESSERFMLNNNHTIFQNLIVWQRAMELVEEIYRLIKFLPKEETYALSDQMRRAVVSIPSNIAEGAGRKTNSDFAHFLVIARGSRYELETQILICIRLGFIKEEQAARAL